MNRIDRLRAHTPYETDFAQWCAEQGALLRDGRLSDLDRENLAEEIESLGRRDRREIRSRMEVLIAHLLGNIVKDSPSLRRYPAQIFDEAYGHALPVAVRETGLKKSHFPSEPPFTSKQALDGRFWPGGPLSMDDFLRD